MLIGEEFTVRLQCDEPHPSGDKSGLIAATGASRVATYSLVRAQGWYVAADGSKALCPYHLSPETHSLGDLERLRTDIERLVADLRNGTLRGVVTKNDGRFIRSVNVVVEGEGPFAEHLGVLSIHDVRRTWDRIVPPGARNSEDADAILLGREQLVGMRRTDVFHPSLRDPIFPALSQSTRGNRIGEWLAGKSMEWRILRPDVWGTYFAADSRRAHWTFDTWSSPECAAFVYQAMHAFAAILVAATPAEFGRKRDF